MKHKLHASIGSLSSENRRHKGARHSDVELGPRPGSDTPKALSLPYFNLTPSNFALNGAPLTPGSAATSSHPFVSATLVSPAMPQRPTEHLKSIPAVKISPVTSERSTPLNRARSHSMPVPQPPVVQRPVSPVAWHLPSRSRSTTTRENLKHEYSDSEYSHCGVSTPPPATPDTEGRNQPVVLSTKIFEAARAFTPSPSVCNDPLLSVRDSVRSSLSPTPESVRNLYKSFPEPPDSNPKAGATLARPATAGSAPTIRASAPVTAFPTVPAALKGPVRPLTIQTGRRGSSPMLSPPLLGLPGRPTTASQAGALSVPTSRPSSASSQGTLVSPKRPHKSTSVRGSLVSLAEDSFLMPPRTPPTPQSPSLSSLRLKTPPRPTSSRNATYFGSGFTKPQPEERLSFECKGEINATSFTPRSL